MDQFDVLIRRGDADARPLRPTLYDFLAHRALAFYQNTEPELIRPANRFELNQPGYLAEPAQFAAVALPATDTLSLHYRALELYQRLIRFHQPDRDSRALADADAARLIFVHEHSTLPAKDTLYEQTLYEQTHTYRNQPAELFYGLAPIQGWINEGDRTNTGNWRRRAAEHAADLLRRFPNAGLESDNLRRLLLQVNCQTVTLTVEEGNAPDKPIRALVTYRNVPTLHYRIVRVAADQPVESGWGNDAWLKALIRRYLSRKAVAVGSVHLPDDGDRNEHRTEIALPALPLGHYVVLTSDVAKPADSTPTLSYVPLIVTNLGYVIGPRPVGQKETATDDRPKLYVMNRQTGQPLAGVRAIILESTYDRGTPNVKPVGERTTDAAGGVILPGALTRPNRSYQFRLLTSTDTLETESVYVSDYSAPPNDPANKPPRVLLFTDRAIYRPGQPIYFKAVLYTGVENQYSVLANRQTEAKLTDVNNQTVQSLTLTSNEFGTVQGQFTAPVGRMTGGMNIKIEEHEAYIRVEEYKRPTFEVSAGLGSGSYKLGQSVRVVGRAKTFAGAVVDGASVHYRVTRRLRPRWLWWARDGGNRYGDDRASEVISGTLTADATGGFSVTFAAQPDASVDRATNPTFDFSVQFDVTDPSGETHVVAKTLAIGYSALTARLDLPVQVDNRNRNVPLRVTNAGDERVSVTGRLTIYPLQLPARPLRKRPWEKPDRYVLTADQFHRLFPNDVYADEDELPNRPKGQPVEMVAVGPGDTLPLALSRYPAGVYAAQLEAQDSTGERVTLTQYFAVLTEQQPLQTALPDGWVQAGQTEAKPRQTVTFWLGNDGPGWALMRVLQREQVRDERWVELTGKPVRIEIPVRSEHVGGFVVSFAKVRDGQLLDVVNAIDVPIPDKQLRIETLTFRDHLKPGQPEAWTLRISGSGEEKLLTEAVATLYDASLDAFASVRWPDLLWLYHWHDGGGSRWNNTAFEGRMSQLFRYREPNDDLVPRRYDALKWPNYLKTKGAPRLMMMNANAVVPANYQRVRGGGGASAEIAIPAAPKMEDITASARKGVRALTDEGNPNAQDIVLSPGNKQKLEQTPVNPRRNLNETAFFFPTLRTDEQGRILLKFTMPEALTRWLLLLFAHTPDLKVGSLERTVVTQKELMVTINAPRFLREGDTLRLTARVNNLTAKPLTGTVQLDIFDALTNAPINAKVGLKTASLAFSTAANQSTTVGWTLTVPTGLENVTVRITASAGDFSDGEERILPVLLNRMLVLDSQPFYVNGPGKKDVALKTLANANPELPMQAERLTVELTSNPVWTALQSLPYLAEFPYECAEQLFSRFYANTLAARILNARPDIRLVTETWAKQTPTNPLEANQELKGVTFDETPWRRDTRDQNAQLAQLGRFLTDDNLRVGQQTALEKLRQLQTPDGGFMWFSGMPTDPTVTLHVLAGLAHLTKLGATFAADQQRIVQELQTRGLAFADARATDWVRQQQTKQTADYVGYWPVQYLYTRSFYPQQPMGDRAALACLQANVVKNWLKQGLPEQAMIALALHRLGDTQTPVAILKSLKERSAGSDELGMYWPDNQPGYGWQQAPVETQALLIEAFDEIAHDQTSVDAMKRWLLAQKRTQAWPSTKATTEAIYALLLRGDDWLETKPTTELAIGGKVIETAANGPTGYQRVTYQPADIKPALGSVTIRKTGRGPAWGGIYYQHFEPLDRVPASTGDLAITKTLYLRSDLPNGPVLLPVTNQTKLKPGDLLTVRLVLRNDRAMQYVHLKDSRGSGFEPTTALSGYTYQNGLGYYEAPRDAGTDFYLNALPAGTHVFEYTLRVVHTGDFSAGVATVQCFYAPEFSAHSTGERVRVNAQ